MRHLRQHLVQQRPLLRVAVLVRHERRDRLRGRVEHRQRLARQRRGRARARDAQPVLAPVETLPSSILTATPSSSPARWPCGHSAMSSAARSAEYATSAAEVPTSSGVELAVERRQRHPDLALGRQLRRSDRAALAQHHLRHQLVEARKQQCPRVLRLRHLLEPSVEFRSVEAPLQHRARYHRQRRARCAKRSNTGLSSISASRFAPLVAGAHCFGESERGRTLKSLPCSIKHASQQLRGASPNRLIVQNVLIPSIAAVGPAQFVRLAQSHVVVDPYLVLDESLHHKRL